MSRVERWNIPLDLAHASLAKFLLGARGRPRLTLRVFGQFVGAQQEELDAAIQELLAVGKHWREQAIQEWIGSGVLHHLAFSTGLQYTLLGALER